MTVKNTFVKVAFELWCSCVCEKCSKIETHKVVEYTGKISVVIFYTKTPSMNCTHLHVITVN